MKWIKFTERECDLFTAYCIMMGYLNYYKKNIGRNIENFLLMSKNGIIHSWRLEDEYNDFLSNLKNKKIKKLDNLLDKLNLANEELKKFLGYKYFSNFTDKRLIIILRKFVKVYQNYFALFTLPKYFGMVLDENEIPRKTRIKLKQMRGIADYEKIQKKFLILFFEEIGRRRNIKTELLFYALPEEIKRLLKGKSINKDSLKKRKKMILFLTREGKTKVFLGDKARKILESNIKEENNKIGIIKGSIANKGFIRGRTRVILREKDLKNLDGKIIVAPMTSIKFVPYLKKVKAIVTNEGGIACHAAIISRELKIPCIVGTKNATKVLKDGDLVEVDANKGVVKIIKKS